MRVNVVNRKASRHASPRAMARGFSQDVCDAIWGDIEFFARYGFNKAHAADYAKANPSYASCLVRSMSQAIRRLLAEAVEELGFEGEFDVRF